MKCILLAIYSCIILTLTACGKKITSIRQNEDLTKWMDKNTENQVESMAHIEEISDEDYLLNLGRQLKLGMSVQEIISKIGEPDEYMGSGILYLKYNRGNCSLNIMVGSPYGNADDIYVYNKESNQSTSVYSYGGNNR